MSVSLPLIFLAVGAIILVSGFYLALRSMSDQVSDKVPFRGFGRTVNISLRDKVVMALGTLLIILGLILAGYQAFLNQPFVC